MKITNETELMMNQKGSLRAIPDQQFEALQTIEGCSLLFSIGTDGILFCTREVPGDTHGWVRVDLSSYLYDKYYASIYPNSKKAFSAKTFDIAQDLNGVNTVDIALVVTYNNQDYLHIASGFTNTLDNWANATPDFEQFKFDYPGDNINAYQAMPVNEVQILDSNDGNGTQYIIVDLVQDPNTKTIARFYIDSNSETIKKRGYAWLPHNLPNDLQAGKITTFLGCGPNDGPNDNNTGGVYVFGAVNNEAQLIYAPTYNFYHPEMQIEPTVINIPDSAKNSQYSAIAVSAPASNAPYTDLFFVSNYIDGNGATQGGLFFLANADQYDTETTKPVPALVYTNDLLKNIQSLHIENWSDNIVLWGQSEYTDTTTTPSTSGSQLFIMEGVAGQETNADAWSCPIPLLFDVENSSSYVNSIYSLDSSIDSVNGNAYGSCSVLFAHQADGSLVQLFQDPVTSAWQERHILTVPNTYLDMYENSTYTTHICITDDNNIPQPGITAYLWSSSPTSVYVNNVYSMLAFDTPLQTTADVLGNINITQPVDSIGGICYYIAVQDPSSQQWFTQVVNPIAVTNANLAKQVPDGTNNHIGGTVPDEQGAPLQLAGSGSTAQQQLQTSQSIYSFGQHNSDVNSDGLTADQKWPDPATAIAALKSAVAAAPSAAAVAHHGKIQRTKKFAKPDRQAKHMRFDPKKDKIWGCTFGKNGKHYEGIEAMKEMGVTLNNDGSLSVNNVQLGSIFSHIEAKAGHLFKWMKSEAHKLESAVIQLADDGLDCLLTIAGSVYHFVVHCMNDIANAIHTALNAIEAAFKELISWIGALFAWGDIKRTHQVLKQMFSTYAKNCISNISNIQDLLNYAAREAITDINSWASLDDDTFPSDSYSSQNANVDQTKGQHSPSSNWGHHQANNNASSSTSGAVAGDIGDLLDDFLNAVGVEVDIIIHAVDEIKDIVSNITSQPLVTTIKQIVAVLADALIESTVNVTDTLLTAAGQLLTDLIDNTLGAKIYIPVLSNLYKTFVGDDLTILDLACLVMAIPVNIVYKLANDKQAPFPDNDSTTALINAATFGDFITAAANMQQPGVSATALSLKDSASDDWENFTGWLEKHWVLVGNICALFGSIGVSVFGVLKSKRSDSYAAASLFTAFYLPYIAPDIVSAIMSAGKPGQYWYNFLNVAIAGAAFIKNAIDIYCVSEYKKLNPAPAAVAATALPKKVLVGAEPDPVDPPVVVPPEQNVPAPPMGDDPGPTSGWRKPFTKQDGTPTGKTWTDISPFVESFINLVWYAPVIAAYLYAKKHNFNTDPTKGDVYGSYKANVLLCTGNSMFNFGGMISFIPSFGPPPVNAIAMGVQVVMNLGYGSMTLASTWE